MGKINNDWIVAGLNNPEFTTSDFIAIAELNTDNTQLLAPEEYLKYDFITKNEAFLDENNKFSPDKFLEHYNQRLYAFNELRSEEAPMYDMFDIQRKPGSRTVDVQYSLNKGFNPDRKKIGIEGVNVVSDPEWSRRELAKREKVLNFTTGKFEEYSVNDVTLVESITEWIKQRFSDPLVLAAWDEDGEHINPITGESEKHKAGDLKINDNGTYFYETLGGRSAIGKDILSTFDTLSVDGKGINKYDFFDSNDIEKSTSGVIAKNVAAILPMFIPYVGTAYAAAQVVGGLASAAPMLYGMASSLLGWEDSEIVNTIGAHASAWKTSSSDYSRNNTTTFENFASLVSDVALQWGQQKAIAQAFNSMKKTNAILDEAKDQARAYYNIKKATMGESEDLWQAALNKFMPAAQKKMEAAQAIGRNVSLGYMAITSNTDVYNSMLEHGATKGEASAVALGSTIGMFLFDKYSDLGELFFDEATSDVVKASRKAIKDEFSQASKAFEIISKSDAPQRSKIVQMFTKAAEVSKKAISKFSEDLKYHTTSAIQKVIGEGLEEVGEEFTSDLSKGIYEMLNTLGIYKGTVSDVGAFDDALSRYGQSFFGGAVGGALFYGVEAIRGNRGNKKEYADIATLIRNGHADDLRKELIKLAKRGHAGSKTLSATAFERTDDGTTVWRTASSYEDSQEKAVMDMVNDKITSIQEVLENNRANLNDDELFENMVLSETRFRRYKEISGITNYYDDFSNILSDLIQTELELKDASDTMTGLPGGTPIPSDRSLGSLTPEQIQERQNNLDRLKDKRDAAKTKLDEFMSGDTSLEYTRKLHFAMDPMLHSPFLALSQEEYFKSLYPGKSADDLTQEEMVAFVTQQWPDYVRTQLKANLNTAWQAYKDIEAKLLPSLGTVDLSKVDSRYYLDNLKVLNEKLDSFDANSIIDYDTKLEGESEEDYKNRSTKLDGESEEEYNKRRWDRYRKVRAEKQRLIEEWANGIKTFIHDNNINVDSNLRRRIKQHILSSQRGDDLRREALLFAFNEFEFGGINSIRNKVLDLIINAKSKEDFKKIENEIFKIRKYGLLLNDRLNFKPDNIAKALSLAIRSNIIDRLTSEDEFKKLQRIAYSLFNGIDDNGEEITIGHVKDGTYSSEIASNEEEGREIEEFISSLIDPDTGKNVFGLRDREFNDLTFGQLFDILGFNIITDNTGNYNGVSKDEYINDLERHIQETLTEERNNRLLADSKANVIFDKIKQVFNNTISEVESMSVYQLQYSPISGNPVLENILINLAGEEAVAELNKVLDAIQSDYDDISDITQLVLNDAQISSLEKGKKALEIVRAFIYSASTKTSSITPVGHNRTINEFAEHNKGKLRKEWKKLVEIDDGIASMYAKTIDDLIEEADRWITFSNNNNINKLAKIKALGKDFNSSLVDYLKSLPRSVRVNVGGEDKILDILAGIDNIDASNLEEKHASVLYQVERLIYKNINQFAADNGLSIEELIENTDILPELVHGIQTVGFQESIPPFANMTSEDITPFDRLQYLAMIIAEDPAVYNKELASRVASNPQVVPIVGQEFAARLAVVSMSDTFKSILKKGRSYSNAAQTTLENTTIIFGVAGAGKTQVVLNAVDSRLKDSEVFISGPTAHQASNMGRAMGRSNPMTFEELFHRIIGKSTYDAIKNADPTNNEYFTIFNSNGGTLVKLKDNSKITFSSVSPTPKAIYIDEATHLSTVEALILDAYAKQVGAQVFLIGDEGQNGYSKPISKNNERYIIENIGALNVFSARTPTLALSLRDANLQKFINLENVRSVLSTFISYLNHASDEDYKGLFSTLESAIRNFNFRVYTDDDINGDLITPDLDDKTLSLLKKAQEEGKSIAFIGDSSSPMLSKLRNAGISVSDNNVLDATAMQGQEFDYVVIDQDFKDINSSSSAYFFLKNLYTLMSRAREGSIFIDNGLSKIIGENTSSPYKTPAPSILSAADALSKERIASLQEIDFSPIEIANKVERKVEDLTVFDDPEENPITDEEKEVIKEIEEEIGNSPNFDGAIVDETIEKILNGEGPTGNEALSKFPIQAYSDVTLLGVKSEVREEPGEKTQFVWTIHKPTDDNDAPLRNLQGLINGTNKGDEVIYGYTEKIKLQRLLQSIKGVIQYGGEWDSLPQSVRDNIVSKDNWGNGKYIIEFREVDDSIDSLPIGSNFQQAGIEYTDANGNTKRIIANLVFEFENNNGKKVRIDLAGLNNPKTLSDNKISIKDRFNQIINSQSDDATKKRLKEYVDNIDAASKAYEDWFREQVSKIPEGSGESHTIDATGAVTSSEYLWLSKRRGTSPIRLGGEYDPTKDGEYNLNSLRARNSHLVFSPVYAFANEGDESIISKSFRGKTVVFVTEDPTLKREDLAEIYFDQKNSPTAKAKVRAIMLSNQGISFRDLTNFNFFSKYKDTTGSISRPVKQDHIGINMFTSLWNARASLLQLSDKLIEWGKANNGYNINEIAELEYLVFLESNKGLSDEEQKRKNDILSNYEKDISKHSVKQGDLLNKLNELNEILKDIPMFRIGYSSDKTRPYFIRQFEVKDSKVYKNGEINLVSITKDGASDLLKMLDFVLSYIAPYKETLLNKGQSNTANLKIDRIGDDGSHIVIEKNQLIDLNNDSHKRTLSGLLSFTKDGITIEDENGASVLVAQGNEWSAIPQILGKLSLYSQNDVESANDVQGTQRTITYKFKSISNDGSKTGDNETKKLSVDFSEIYRDILKDNNHALSAMLDLVFHGTTDNFRNSGTPKHAEAIFKNGIYISPLIEYSQDKEYVYGGVKLYPIKTNEAFLLSDVDVRSSGFTINVQRLIDNLSKAQDSTSNDSSSNPAPSQNQTEKSFLEKKLETKEAQEIFNVLAKEEDRGLYSESKRKSFYGKPEEEQEKYYKGAIEAYNMYLKKKALKHIKGSMTISTDLNFALDKAYILDKDLKVVTLRKHLEGQGYNDFKFKSEGVFTASKDGKIYEFRVENGGLSITEIKQQDTNAELKSKLETFNGFISELLNTYNENDKELNLIVLKTSVNTLLNEVTANNLEALRNKISEIRNVNQNLIFELRKKDTSIYKYITEGCEL